MKNTQSRGLRNNNPLNIRHSASRWQGARKEQTDPSFVQFTSMVMGYRAAWRVLESYWLYFKRKHTAFTPRSIIHRWAPPKENNSESYLRTVCLLSGLGGNEALPRPRTKLDFRLTHLLAAMACVECGMRMNEVNMDEIREGYEKAFTN